MATLVLSAAGAALGGSVGGSFLGVTAAALGKAVGASIGSALDQKLLGSGSQPVHSGKVDSFRIQGAAEGEPISRVFGRMRVPGHVIWSSRFVEHRHKRTSGSKAGSQTVVNYSYTVSLAIALCEGEITNIGRVWADGNLITLSNTTWRLYHGREDQMPDAMIEAVEGLGNVPAYRGTAYIVLEDLDLGKFGNRIPQFNFEVVRKVAAGAEEGLDPYAALRGVALIPGSGEYALATTPVRYQSGKGVSKSANVNSASKRADIDVSLDALGTEMPNVSSVSLVTSWFGDDLRCGHCSIQPRVEQSDVDGDAMPWTVNGVQRANASLVSRTDGKPSFGGTPADASVIEAIQRIHSDGNTVLFYPFLLMDVPSTNTLTDPWTGNSDQPAFPWRGRITTEFAPGLPGSTDQSAASASEVAAFFGTAAVNDFSVVAGQVVYSGPAEWSYRRFILHYAHLCALAGGVDAFCIGSEMVSLNRIRDGANAFPAVAQLVQLAQDVRGILGGTTRISYAADWSEYFGYHPQDGSGDLYFHLDDLWASPDVDFIGIDNYMPLSDWRDAPQHADKAEKSIYSLSYLMGNVQGGEGYDWYYASDSDRDQQLRTPITDGAYNEPWVYRYKDIRNWWSNPHHNRIGGVRSSVPTAWVPESKPFWFTELGCPAVDKGTNQPNVFVDPKSAESSLPHYSVGSEDSYIQHRYYQAHATYWADAGNNPVSSLYGAEMVDWSRAYAWAWDARPWPDFPARSDIWSDYKNHRYGHWLSGRTSMARLSGIVSEISAEAGVVNIDTSDLYGAAEGYLVRGLQTGRESLQPLMLAHAFDAVETSGALRYASRLASTARTVSSEEFVVEGDGGTMEKTRQPSAEVPGRVIVNYYASDQDYQRGAATGASPDDRTLSVEDLDLPIALSQAQAEVIAQRWLVEAEVSRDRLSFALPPSQMSIGTGDTVLIDADGHVSRYRIDRQETGFSTRCEATRVEEGTYWPTKSPDRTAKTQVLSLPGPVHAELLDLPLLTGDEKPHAPHIAVAGLPWVGDVAVHMSPSDADYELNTVVTRPATVGTTLLDFAKQRHGLWSGGVLRVQVTDGQLFTRDALDVLNGANVAAIRAPNADEWEVLQFQTANLVGPNIYELETFLRGQQGTATFIPESYPAGSDFVLLDGALRQIDLPSSARGLVRYYRVGPASETIDDPSYVELSGAFKGVGLRPYAPVHLRVEREPNGDISARWTRQTRVDGDSWLGFDVPLGETQEGYIVDIESNGQLVRRTMHNSTQFTYLNSDQISDGIGASFTLSVAQISDQFGAGPFKRIDFNG